MTKTAIAFALIALAVFTAPPVAEAREEVLVEVTSISASTHTLGRSAAPEVDARLAGFAKKLKALFAYTHYAFLGKSQARATYGGSAAIQLPERFSLEVEPERRARGEDDRIDMVVTLLRDVGEDRPGAGRSESREEVVLRTRIRLENGGTVLLGGPPIAGGVLILALSARG